MNFKKAIQGVYKFGIKYIPRITPGVGLASLGVREYKKRKGTPFPYYNLRKKEDRRAMGKYAFQIGLIGFFVFKAGVTYKGMQRLINKIKEPQNIEQTRNKEQGNLEKTIMYKEAIKSLDD